MTRTPQDKLTGPTLRHHLPECATQQVCNTLFVRMNHTQRLCECSRNYDWGCNSHPAKEDGHTIELTRRHDKKVYTQVKLCEPLASIRACKTPTDWSLLALQSERSGRSHYVVVCRCPENSLLDGPYTHNHPPYARIPGEPLMPISICLYLISLTFTDCFVFAIYGTLCRDTRVWHAVCTRWSEQSRNSPRDEKQSVST